MSKRTEPTDSSAVDYGRSDDAPVQADAGSTVDLGAFGLDREDWLDRVRAAAGMDGLGKIGDYEIVGEVGYGGQGIVYRARQPRTNRDIALKRLRAGSLTGGRARLRFEREVETAAALNHPNIVTVFGAEVINDSPTLAMQWIDGTPIDEWATRKQPDVRRRLGVFRKLCGAVQYAHQRGIIHRDLKPQNILVDEHDEPFVLDFGLAKLESSDNRVAITRSAEFVGTLAYAAPEQLESERDSLDARTDVYALGAVLYRLLTGRHPHDPNQPLARLIEQIRTRDVIPPSHVFDALNPEIDAIVLKALQSDPAQRYQSVDALLADIERYLAGDVVLALPPSTTYQLRKLIRRHRLPFIVGAVAAVAIVLLALVLAVQAVRLANAAETQRQLKFDAQREERIARAEAKKAITTYEFLERMLITDDSFDQIQPNARLKDLIDDAVALLDDGAFADQPDIEASLRLTLGRAYEKLMYSWLAEPQVEMALDVKRSLFGERSPECVEAMLYQSSCIWEQGRFEEAEVILRRAAELARDLPQDHVLLFVQARWMQCSLLRDLFRFDEAEAIGREVLADTIRLYGPESRHAGHSHYRLGHCLKTAGRPAEAQVHLRQALSIQKMALGDHHPQVARTNLRLGQALMELEKYDEAMATMLGGYDILEERFGQAYPGLCKYLREMARVERRRGEVERAAMLYEQEIEHYRKYYAGSPGGLNETLAEYARLRAKNGQLEEAISLMKAAIEDQEAVADENHPRLWRKRLRLAGYLERSGRFIEAEALLLDYFEVVQAGLCCGGARHTLDEAETQQRLFEFYAAWAHSSIRNAFPFFSSNQE